MGVGRRLSVGKAWAAARRFVVEHEELSLYVAAGVAYIILGVAVKQALAWMIEAALFLWLTVWILPLLVRRARAFFRDRRGSMSGGGS